MTLVRTRLPSRVPRPAIRQASAAAYNGSRNVARLPQSNIGWWTASMQAIRDYYVARNAVVLGDVALAPGANVWYGSVLRGDLATITLGPRVNLQDGCVVHTDFGCPMLIEE